MTYTSDIKVDLIQHIGGDHMIVAAAKVSTSGSEAESFANEDKKEANYGLINYLMKHRHGTPFEHGSLTFFVKAPIFVWREHHRHRIGWSYNEESGRYKQLEPVFWIPRPDRKIVPIEGYKAARPQFTQGTDEQYNFLTESLKKRYTEDYQTYELLLQKGYAKEVARSCLPVATYSSCWTTCNPRSIMAFLSLRTHDKEATFVSYPQAEIEEVARQYEECFATLWPLTYKSFVENGRIGP